MKTGTRIQLFFTLCSILIFLGVSVPSFAQLAPPPQLLSECWVAYSPTIYNPKTTTITYPLITDIRDDLLKLQNAGFTAIVTYGSHGTLGKIPEIAVQLGFKAVLMGIWNPASQEERTNARTAAQAYPAVVVGYVVGNEGLIEYSCRRNLVECYTLPVLQDAINALRPIGKPIATSEIPEVYGMNPNLLNLGDWVFPNVHPYHANKLDPVEAANWTDQEYQRFTRMTNRFVMFKEVGLPTAEHPGGLLNETIQADYYRLLSRTNTRFVYFEAYNQFWKLGPSNRPDRFVERNWGLFYANHTPKEAVQYVCGRIPSPATLPPGLYDDRNTNIIYSVGWPPYNNPGPSNNTLKYTKVPNATAEFRFNGSGIILYRTLAFNRGNMEVCIDGVPCQTINNYSATLQWNVPVTFHLGSVATRNVRIRNLSSSYIDLDAVRVQAGVVALQTGLHQQNNPNITYFGNWVNFNNAAVNGGSLIYSNDPNARAEFQINGDALTLYRTRAFNRGPMQVCIDAACQTVANTTSTLQWNIPYTFTSLGAGVHSVVIRNLSSSYIDLDAVRVSSTPAALGPGTYDERSANIIYNGLWYVFNGAGPYTGTLLYTNTPGDEIRFRITGQAFRLYRTTASNRGPMQVCIDTMPCVSVNNNSAGVVWSVPRLFGSLGPGTHTVVIRHTGTASQYIDLDRVVVYSTTPPA